MGNYFRRILLPAIFLIANYSLQAQTIYSINHSKENDIKLSGTSTLHDWTMNAHSFTGEAKFNNKGNDIITIQAFKLILPVESLKSKDKAMDHNAYKALKTEKYTLIVFKLTSSTNLSNKNNIFTYNVKGDLSIAGITNEINIDVSCQVYSDKTITCSGIKKLKMTDYRVEPPSFMFGAMTTGNEMTLAFNVVFEK